MLKLQIKNSVLEHYFKGENIENQLVQLVISKLKKDLQKYVFIKMNFEKKYKMTFKKFEKSLKEPCFEIEQDYFDWDMSITAIEDIMKEIDKLKCLETKY